MHTIAIFNLQFKHKTPTFLRLYIHQGSYLGKIPSIKYKYMIYNYYN